MRRHVSGSRTAVAVAVVLAGAVVALASQARSSGVGHYQTRPAKVTGQEVTLTTTPLTAAERRSINRTLDAFVPAALRRDHAARAYALATSSFRGGTTRAAWVRGDLPVMPYPAAGTRFHGWRVDFTSTDSVGIDLEVQPTDPAKVGLVAFTVVLQRQHGQWLIDAFAPVANFQPTGTPANIQAEPDYSPAARGSGNPVEHLNQNWIFLPLLVVSAPLLLLLGAGPLLLWRGRRRGRPIEHLDDYYTAMRRVRDDQESDAAIEI